MRRFSLALLVLPLALACASQPKKLSGRYAIEVDPWLASRHSAHGTYLHERVTASLQRHLSLAATAADADAVILLKRGATDGDLAYEIRRAGDVVVSTEPTTTLRIRPADGPIANDLERERVQSAVALGEPVLPVRQAREPLNPDVARREADELQARRIVEMIVYDLRPRR